LAGSVVASAGAAVVDLADLAADDPEAEAAPAGGDRLHGRAIMVTTRSSDMTFLVQTRRVAGAMTMVMILAIAGSGCSYNTFTSQEESIKGQWAQVENQLQRRSDLIPNLVETTKGFAQQEKDVFGAVADARAKMAGATTPTQKIEAANMESSALARLLVVVENYPQLKSDATFARLMDSLEGTENRLATERMRYNEKVQAYNTLRRQFPSNITAKMFSFAEYPYWEVPADAKTAPKVNFGK
jgi:LemA protein